MTQLGEDGLTLEKTMKAMNFLLDKIPNMRPEEEDGTEGQRS